MTSLICDSERRRETVRQHEKLLGLDYLEVGANQLTLTVHFLGKAPHGSHKLSLKNVLIEGGRRIRDIKAVSVETHHSGDPEFDDKLEVGVDRAGDFSTYTLRIVARDAEGHPQPHPSFDPRYDSVEFSFKVDCPSDLDCPAKPPCPPEKRNQPEINYLAKDYTSFRQLILDRLALVMPEWQERHVPDIGIALVELLAYAGDYLSYYQDAVATEAYLDTARQRISVRRHARLVDYQLHEGSNARAWVTVKTVGDLTGLDPRDVYFITLPKDSPSLASPILKEEDLARLGGGYEVFEPVTSEAINLYESHYEISFYTWGDDECCLDRGATSATLFGELIVDPDDAQTPDCDPYDDAEQPQEAPRYDRDDELQETPQYDRADQYQDQYEEAPRYDTGEDAGNTKAPKLRLKPGDVLIFEEVIGPKTGNPSDADPAHRHAVRLTRVEAGVDPLDRQPVVEIGWALEDALPFTLCISVLGPPPDCEIIHDISVARGNVMLVDHGRTVDEDSPDVPVKETLEFCECDGLPGDRSTIAGTYRPVLEKAPLTFRQPLEANTPATHALIQDIRKTLPQVRLESDPAPNGDPLWLPQSDLLGSSYGDQHFVAEIDDGGRAHLRFGDGELGRCPAPAMKFHAVYRVGNGTAGNVGAEAIAHIAFHRTSIPGGITKVRNPMPASGGAEPEPIAEAKLFAPHAFRQELQRAITADDYRALVERDFKSQVQRAAATLRWNGGRYEALVAVDEFGKEEADPSLLSAIHRRLYRYRRIGHDLHVTSARLVPLLIEMHICVKSHYLRGHVKGELLDLFSDRVLADGRKGFFHPDNLSFGDGVYLSRLVATAQAVEGVESVEVTRLERLGEGPNGEIEFGVLPLGPLEIAQVDNDPSLPENGTFTLKMGGGR